VKALKGAFFLGFATVGTTLSYSASLPDASPSPVSTPVSVSNPVMDASTPSILSPAPLPLLSPVPISEASPQPSPSGSGAVSLFKSDAVLDSAMEEQVSPDLSLPDLTLDKTGGFILTLDNSVKIAIESATQVLKAKNQVSVSGADLLQSYGLYLPSINATANYGYSSGTTYYTTAAPTSVNGSNLGAAYGIVADLNIFNGLTDYSKLKAALLRKDISNLSLDRAKQAVALDITQSFLNVVLDNQLVAIAEKNLQESQEREKLLLEQTRVGARNLSDLFRQQAQTSQDQSLVLTSENKTRTDQVNFLKKLRADVAKKYHFVDPQIPDERAEGRFADESELLRTALLERPDLKAADQSADAAHWDVKNAWGNYLPKLDVLGSMTSGAHYLYSQQVNGSSVVPPTQSTLGYQLGTQIDYSVGLYLTWNVFDRFLTHDNVVHARIAADNADIDAQDFRNAVEGDVRQAFGSYETAIQQLLASKKGLVAAQKAYEVIEGRYEVGSASFIDLITAQATLLQAEETRAQALIDFLLQGKTLEFAIGETKIN
jgi:outer membrane protein